MTTRPPTAPSPASEPVGVADIARRLGVRPGTVHAWTHRFGQPYFPEFPGPEWVIGGQRLWEWRDIEEWAVSTGRV